MTVNTQIVSNLRQTHGDAIKDLSDFQIYYRFCDWQLSDGEVPELEWLLEVQSPEEEKV